MNTPERPVNPEDIAQLRQICRGYPGDVVADVVAEALPSSVGDVEIRRGLAALVAHWVASDVEEVSPPLSPEIVALVLSGLRKRAH